MFFLSELRFMGLEDFGMCEVDIFCFCSGVCYGSWMAMKE